MVSGFLQEDIFNFKEDTKPLIEKILLSEYVDFQLSQNGKLVTKMQNHQLSSDSRDKIINALLFKITTTVFKCRCLLPVNSIKNS